MRCAPNAPLRPADFQAEPEEDVPGGLIALARARGRGDEEEGASVGATKYMLDEMHHKNMVQAFKGGRQERFGRCDGRCRDRQSGDR